MGEEVDLSKMEMSEDTTPAPTIQKGDHSAMIRQVKALIKQGRKHRDISKSLRAMGFTYIDIERIMSQSDAELYDETHKKFDYATAVIAVVAILVLAATVTIIGSQLVSGATDCAEDALCAQKILYCTDGLYSSSFAGTSHEYDIRKAPSSCRVIERVLESAIPGETPGMSMVCTYPFNGITDSSDKYGPCTGMLADAHR